MTVDRQVDEVQIEGRWVLLRLPQRPLPSPPVGRLNTAEAVAALYR